MKHNTWDIRQCEYRYCRRIILPGKHGTRHYCCAAHRQAEYRLREKEFMEGIREIEIKEDVSIFKKEPW